MIRIALQAVPTAVLLLSRRHFGNFGPVFWPFKEAVHGFLRLKFSADGYLAAFF
jgi:hypothetical protein